MGAYLSTPIRDKESIDAETKYLNYGASSMQGWRVSQEDAHNCLTDFDVETKTSLFAVYDGHGGAEVAQYTATHLPDFIKGLAAYKEGRLAQALEDAFLGFDEVLTKEEVIAKLQELAGVNPDPETEAEQDEEAKALCEEADMPIQQLMERYGGAAAAKPNAAQDESEEAEALCEEATMPLQSLLARYGGATSSALSKMRKKDKFQSPALRPKKGGASNDEGADTESAGDDDVRMRLETKLVNGHSENENNENLEREHRMQQLPASSSNSAEPAAPVNGTPTDTKEALSASTDSKDGVNASADTKDTVSASSDSNQAVSSAVDSKESNVVSSSSDREQSKSDSKSDIKEESPQTTAGSSSTTEASASKSTSESTAPSSLSSSDASVTASQSTAACSSSSSQVGVSSAADSSSGPAGGSSSAGSSSSSSSAGGSSQSATDHEQGGSGAGSSTGKARTKRKNIIPEEGEDESSFDEDEEDTDEDSDDSGAEWKAQTGSDSEDDDEEDSEDDEGDDDDGPTMMCGGEEPGADSGCTAVVALLRGRELYVANAGDSRCVVSRDGKALDMSVDHKPEDEPEHARILKAGGRVTPDGRVNGGLNLSRALGDHCYKKNEALPDREQMITALPDVRCLSLEEQDDFMILACDGIWNVMTSQEAVDFVAELVKGGKDKLSEICEHMFDYCLAPNTEGDGTGCDNMTCIIVRFNHKDLEVGSLKRRASNGDIHTESDTKKSKADETADSSEGKQP